VRRAGAEESAADAILVPLDGSPADEAVVALVEALAPPGADVVLLHARTPALARGRAAAYHRVGGRRPSLERHLRRFQDRLAQAGLRARVTIRTGEPVREILAAAAREEAGLIAMATRGRRGLSRLLLGSLAEEVVRRARVPVLVVPAHRRRPG
jgi:nucleotide-binding universal stress UspA family protein